MAMNLLMSLYYDSRRQFLAGTSMVRNPQHAST
jgi:hypothetical protein